ncbi:MAG: 2-oxoacid:acceptor oxidoreductase family protein [Candidatus Hydrothermales bacterium]
MKKGKIDIMWLGRGGMGVKTAALLLGEAFAYIGKYIKAFPEYGPERRGAPVVAFTRISDEPIKGHYGVKDPDIVVVIDKTLLKSKIFKNVIKNNTIILINTNMKLDELKERFNLRGNVKTVDASSISKEIFGKNLPNAPILGALLRILKSHPLEEFIEVLKDRLMSKYEVEIVEKNIEAIKRAYMEVKE